MPHLASGCMVRIILVPFVFHLDHDDWPPHLSARLGLLDLHRAPPLQKLLAAGLPGSLLLVKLLPDFHRAPPLQKLLAARSPRQPPRLLWPMSHPSTSQMP